MQINRDIITKLSVALVAKPTSQLEPVAAGCCFVIVIVIVSERK
jgi:hypothetical protein